MTQGDAKWEKMTDAEFVADLIARHGEEAGRAMAKTMGLPVPKKAYTQANAGWRAGRKPKHGRGIPVPKPTGRTAAEVREERKEMWAADRRGDNEHVHRLYTKRGRNQACPVCPVPIMDGDEVALLAPSWRRVHSGCVAKALKVSDGRGARPS